jgi:hypothetical protein
MPLGYEPKETTPKSETIGSNVMTFLQKKKKVKPPLVLGLLKWRTQFKNPSFTLPNNFTLLDRLFEKQTLFLEIVFKLNNPL